MSRHLILAALLLMPVTAQASDGPPTHNAMALIADRALVDGAKMVRDIGTAGLSLKLEEEYPKAIRNHDKLRATYLIMIDNMQTSIVEQAFPNAHDPFFNRESFGLRAARGINMIEPNKANQSRFIQAMFRTEHDEEERIAGNFADIANATQ